MLAALAVLAAPAIAHADTLAGGPLFVGSSAPQQLASCYVFNAGTTAVALASARIVGPNGQPIALVPTSISCGSTLAAGQLCGIEGGVLSNIPYACTVTTAVAGAGAFLRGTFQLGNAGNNPAAATTPLLLTDTTGLGAKPRPGKPRRGHKRQSN
jgi:hypothetical protein